MKIAFIGWGSLIWNPGGLRIKSKWFNDGPYLPVEFTRISNDNRVTLIIDEEATPIQTLWALANTQIIEDAKESLRDREGVNNVRLISSIGINDEPKNKTEKVIQKWLTDQALDYAVWTGLSFSKKTGNRRPSIGEIINHLQNITPSEKLAAENYVRKAPTQVQTNFRKAIEIEFGWIPF